MFLWLGIRFVFRKGHYTPTLLPTSTNLSVIALYDFLMWSGNGLISSGAVFRDELGTMVHIIAEWCLFTQLTTEMLLFDFKHPFCFSHICTNLSPAFSVLSFLFQILWSIIGEHTERKAASAPVDDELHCLWSEPDQVCCCPKLVNNGGIKRMQKGRLMQLTAQRRLSHSRWPWGRSAPLYFITVGYGSLCRIYDSWLLIS